MEIHSLSNVFIHEYRISQRYGISKVDFSILVALLDSWENKGVGLNCWDLCQAYRYKGNKLSAMQGRVIRLTALGWLDIVGTGKQHSKLYAPTDKAIGIIYEYISNLGF